MADELIRLDTTIIGIDRLITKASTAEEAKVLFTVKDVIYNQQRYVIDVQPVKRGKWEEEDTMPYDNFVVCSECGMNLSPQNYTKEEWQESFKYCPCCGARMDGGAKND